jgi:hypothetical protein
MSWRELERVDGEELEEEAQRAQRARALDAAHGSLQTAQRGARLFRAQNQLLDSLVDAEFLEWLDIQNGFTPVTRLDRFRELPTVILHRLSRIQIRSKVATCLEFLEQIQPAYGCSLALQTDDPADAPTVWGPTLLDSLRRVMFRYAKPISPHTVSASSR